MKNLPWRDAVTVDGATGSRAFPGTVIGNWKSDRVRFEFDASVERSALPAEWQAQLERSQTIELRRTVNVSWKPSMPRVFRSVEFSGLGLAFGLLFTGVLLQTTRWWRLLAAVGCSTRWYNALRLNVYGLFFNLIVPGLTGGDIIRAVLVAREHPGRRAAAAISVLIDRLLSLLILALLGAIVVLMEGEKFAALRSPVLFALCGGVAIVLLYVNPTLRRMVDFSYWLRRMPMSSALRQIDEAFLVYSNHPIELTLAALLSLATHACIALAICALGRAFGDDTLSLLQYVAVSSIGNIASALPIAPGGWGVGEAVYQYLFELIGGDGTVGVAVSITFKLLVGLIGLCGGLFLLLPSGRRQMAELRQAEAKS
jgi:uncharacterized protein (TIRG00374 family)